MIRLNDQAAGNIAIREQRDFVGLLSSFPIADKFVSYMMEWSRERFDI